MAPAVTLQSGKEGGGNSWELEMSIGEKPGVATNGGQ